jgi:hypothetical protein
MGTESVGRFVSAAAGDGGGGLELVDGFRFGG